MDETTSALAAGIEWANNVLDAWECAGWPIPAERYYAAKLNVARIDLKLEELRYGQVKPILERWAAFKRRLGLHRPIPL